MGSSYAQFVVLLLIFIGVMGVTLWVTRWLAGYQKGKSSGSNIELIDSASLGVGKYIQIVRLGGSYYALAVSKDNVTLIGELDRDSLVINDSGSNPHVSFKEIMSRVGSASDREANSNDNNE